jgi:hypothetical protein
MLIGNLRAIDEETLLLQVPGRNEPVRVRRSTIERIDVARKYSRASSGALVGAIAFGIPGAFLGVYVTVGASLGCEGACPASATAVAAGVLAGFFSGAMVGAPIGALIGSASRGERWEPVSLSVAVAPQPRGARVALTLRF